MMQNPPHRPMAGLPQHPPQSHHQSQSHPHSQTQSQSQPQSQSQVARPSAYNPDPRELYPGPRNRLILALKSTVPSEVDWALPRLVLASFDRADAFKLETWIDSVAAFQYWPEKWVEELEKEAALQEVREGRVGAARDVFVLGAIPAWTRDEAVEMRATHSLQVLRNASFTGNNAKLICRATFLGVLERFFALPVPFLLEISLRSPEAFAHILVILQSIIPSLTPFPRIARILTTVIPALLVETRDVAMLHHLIPLLISSLTLPNLPPVPDSLAQHLLYLLTLTPPPNILEYTLDLLISLTLQSAQARQILSLPTFPAHLRTLVMLLEHGARSLQATREAPIGLQGAVHRNPASGAILAEAASRRRTIERDAAGKKLYSGERVLVDVGDKPPQLAPSTKAMLYNMREPRRSITWMHENFVYSSTSQLLQVTFWHAYRDFFTNPNTVEPLLSASEVIKNVTVAFPGASAKVWVDERGENKFVIAGMGFRKSNDDEDRYACLWESCHSSNGNKSAAELLSHVQSAHLNSASGERCRWATCQHVPATISHILTHLPLPSPPPIPEHVTADPRYPDTALSSAIITQRPPPPLPKSFKLHFTSQVTPADGRRQPTGVAFLSALTIRNLARALRSEISSTLPADQGLTKEAKEEKKRHLQEEQFGLPIPDNVLREEEEEEKTAQGEMEGSMTVLERERARGAFEAVEGRVTEVIQGNISGIAQYLGDAFGW